VRTSHTFVQAFSFSTPTTQLHEHALQSTYLLSVQTQACVLAHSFCYSSHPVPECGRILVPSETLSASCCQPPQRNNNTTNLQSTSSLHNHARLLLQSFSCIFIFLKFQVGHRGNSLRVAYHMSVLREYNTIATTVVMLICCQE
jgi:hypothetical protein